MLQQIALGGLMIALPIYLQMVLEYNALQAGLSIAPLSSACLPSPYLPDEGPEDGGQARSYEWAFCCSPSGLGY